MKEAIKGDRKRGKEIIEYFENKGGVNTYSLLGEVSNNYYYIDNENDIHTEGCLPIGYTIIELPKQEKTFPRRMLVWDDYESNSSNMLVLQDLGDRVIYRYICLDSNYEKAYKKGGRYAIELCKHAGEIPTEQLTKEQIIEDYRKQGRDIEIV